MSCYWRFLLLSGVLTLNDIYCLVTNDVDNLPSNEFVDLDAIDPHSLYYRKYNYAQNNVKVIANNQMVSIGTNTPTDSNCDAYLHFSQRLVNMLLVNAKLKTEDEQIIGSIRIEATNEQFKILEAFGKGQITISEVDKVLEVIIKPAESNLDMILHWTDELFIYIYQHRLPITFVAVFLPILLISLKVRWTRLRIIFLLFDVTFVVSIMMTWWQLLQQEEIKVMAQQRVFREEPAECRRHNMTFLESFGLYFNVGKGECVKYVESMIADPSLKVTPLDAFSLVCSRFIFTPLSVAGEHLATFCANMTQNLPFPLNHIAELFLVLAVPCIVVVFFIVMRGGKLEVNIPFLRYVLDGKSQDNKCCTKGNKIEIVPKEAKAVEDEKRQNCNKCETSFHSSSTLMQIEKEIKINNMMRIQLGLLEKALNHSNCQTCKNNYNALDQIKNGNIEDEKNEGISKPNEENEKKNKPNSVNVKKKIEVISEEKKCK